MTMFGFVKWFNIKKGYGFIQRADLPDIFVHVSDLQASGLKKLGENQRVEFEPVNGPRGLKATKLRVLPDLPV
jgi:cold shock protein